MGADSTDYEPREYWSRVAREIAKRPAGALLAGDDTPYFRRKREAFVRRFLRSMQVAGKDVLEIGCGAGVNLVELERLGPRRLVGCDIAPDMVELARATTRDLPGIEIVELTGDGLPFPDAAFDIAFTVTVLNHNHDAMLERVVGEAARVTRERLYLFEDTASRKDARTSYVLRPVQEYADVCARHGFRLVESERLDLYASWLVSTALRTAFNPRRRKEGEPIGRLNAALEEALLPVTGVLDRVVPQRTGVLTKMVFAREARGERLSRLANPGDQGPTELAPVRTQSRVRHGDSGAVTDLRRHLLDWKPDRETTTGQGKVPVVSR